MTDPVGPFDPLLEDAIVRQVEWYMGRVNLLSDAFLKAQMDDDLWVDLAVIVAFPKMKALAASNPAVTEKTHIARLLAARSVVVDVDEERAVIRPAWAQRSSLIIRECPAATNPAVITALFDGNADPAMPVPVSVHPDVGDTWFVIFDTRDGARIALDKIKDKTINGAPIKARAKDESGLTRGPDHLQNLASPMAGAPGAPATGVQNMFNTPPTSAQGHGYAPVSPAAPMMNPIGMPIPNLHHHQGHPGATPGAPYYPYGGVPPQYMRGYNGAPGGGTSYYMQYPPGPHPYDPAAHAAAVQAQQMQQSAGKGSPNGSSTPATGPGAAQGVPTTPAQQAAAAQAAAAIAAIGAGGSKGSGPLSNGSVPSVTPRSGQQQNRRSNQRNHNGQLMNGVDASGGAQGQPLPGMPGVGAGGTGAMSGAGVRGHQPSASGKAGRGGGTQGQQSGSSAGGAGDGTPRGAGGKSIAAGGVGVGTDGGAVRAPGTGKKSKKGGRANNNRQSNNAHSDRQNTDGKGPDGKGEVSGPDGANRDDRRAPREEKKKPEPNLSSMYFPPLSISTENGAMPASATSPRAAGVAKDESVTSPRPASGGNSDDVAVTEGGPPPSTETDEVQGDIKSVADTVAGTAQNSSTEAVVDGTQSGDAALEPTVPVVTTASTLEAHALNADVRAAGETVFASNSGSSGGVSKSYAAILRKPAMQQAQAVSPRATVISSSGNVDDEKAAAGGGPAKQSGASGASVAEHSGRRRGNAPRGSGGAGDASKGASTKAVSDTANDVAAAGDVQPTTTQSVTAHAALPSSGIGSTTSNASVVVPTGSRPHSIWANKPRSLFEAAPSAPVSRPSSTPLHANGSLSTSPQATQLTSGAAVSIPNSVTGAENLSSSQTETAVLPTTDFGIVPSSVPAAPSVSAVTAATPTAGGTTVSAKTSANDASMMASPADVTPSAAATDLGPNIASLTLAGAGKAAQVPAASTEIAEAAANVNGVVPKGAWASGGPKAWSKTSKDLSSEKPVTKSES